MCFPHRRFDCTLGFPGEGPSFGVINITSLMKHAKALANIDQYLGDLGNVSFVFCQETRVNLAKSASLKSVLAKQGWDLLLGPQPEVRRVSSGSQSVRQAFGGVACLFRSGSVQDIAIPKQWDRLADNCQFVWCCSDASSQGFYVFNMYLPTGKHHSSLRALIVAQVFEFLAEYKNQPVFVVGDWQEEPQCNSSAHAAFLTTEWHDVYLDRQVALESTIQATFSRVGWGSTAIGKGRTRIDAVIVNSMGSEILSSIQNCYCCPFPGHAFIHVDLNLPILEEKVTVLKPHPQWTLPPKPRDQEEWDAREKLCIPILLKYADDLAEFARVGNADALWQLVSEVLTEMLNAICGSSLPNTRGNLPKFQQICRTKKIKPSMTPSCQIHKALALSRELLRKAEAFRLRQTTSRSTSNAWLAQAVCVENKLRRTLLALRWPTHVPHISDVDAVHALQSMCSSLEQQIDVDERLERNNTLNKWRRKLRDSNRTNSSEVHRWLKNKQLRSPTLFVQEGQCVSGVCCMLDLICNHLGKLYSTHSSMNIADAIANFTAKYNSIIQQLRFEFDLPEISHTELFNLVQKKSPEKASGLDGWTMKQLHALPPCAWKAIKLVYLVAESHGVWPAAFKLVAVTCIPKDEGPPTPQNMRGIGLCSLVYNVWSSIRFRHCTPWMLQVCPKELYGGIATRNLDPSEQQLSLDKDQAVVDDSSLIAVFLDRWKAFDMIVPEIAFSVLAKLGMDPRLAKAVLGFYHNQKKIFRIGKCYSSQVSTSNGAIQGCAMSLLMTNAMYSVWAVMAKQVSPHVSLATFIDDAKFWAREKDVAELGLLFQKSMEFDKDIGQFINEGKSTVVAPSKTKGKRAANVISYRLKVKTSVRSLGMWHNFSRRSGSSLLKSRISKALQSLKRVKQLPFTVGQKFRYVQSHVHSKWVFGTEIQPPTFHQLRDIRTGLLGVAWGTSRRVRSHFCSLPLAFDVKLDPLFVWAKHVCFKLRSMGKANPANLSQALGLATNCNQEQLKTRNGLPVTVAILFDVLQWEIDGEDSRLITTASGLSFDLLHGSDGWFERTLAEAVANALLRSEHERQDFEGHQKHAELDLEATQMLLNSTLASDDTKGIMASYFAYNREFSHYHKQMIRALLSGGLYLAPRLFKAGFTPSDNCPFCDSQESYEHVVYCCSAYNDERRLVDEHLERQTRTSLFTGVAFKGPTRTELEASRTGRIVRPQIINKCSCDRVFTDGACSVGVLNSAGSGIFAEGKLNLSIPLVGHDHTAPRAELWAVIHAVEATVGNVEIASDCLYVINTATYLLRHGREGLRQLDNFDLWSIFCEVCDGHQGHISLRKVKGHAKWRDVAHDAFLQLCKEGNDNADKLACNAARCVLHQQANAEHKLISSTAMSIQLYWVLVLCKRNAFSDFQDPDWMSSAIDKELPAGVVKRCSCKCLPQVRIRGKTCVCQGCKPSGVTYGSEENAFYECISKGVPIPIALRAKLATRYASYHAKLYQQWHFCSIPLYSHSSLIKGPRKIPPSAAQALVEYFREPVWYRTGVRQEGVTWVELTIDFVSKYGCVGGFLDEGVCMSKLAAAFRAAVLRLFKENHVLVQRFKDLERLSVFSPAKVAGVGLVKQWHDADFLIATLFNLPHSLLQLKSSPKPARSRAYMALWEPIFPFRNPP